MTDFRVGIGRIWHESNGFIRTYTTIRDFESFAGGITVGEELLDQPDRCDEIAGFMDVFNRDSRIELVPLLSAATPPSGLLNRQAVESLENSLRRQLRNAGQLDGICFALHGAMSGEKIADLDGHFLQVLRSEVGPQVPIVCSLDCHAVVTRKMVDLATALTAYRTHIHTDVVETGSRAARILLDTLAGKIKPTLRYQRIPMLFGDPGTDKTPLKRLFDKFIAWDKIDAVVACSLCPSFPYQNVQQQGWTAIAVTDDDADLAEHLARELAEDLWRTRDSLLPESMLAPKEAIRKAASLPGCPVVVTDSADNVGGGASGDTTAILEALLEARSDIDGLALLHIPDPEAVSIVKASNVGETVSLEIGGKCDNRFGQPVPITGQILCVTQGPITDDGKFGSNPTIEVGTIVCLGIDNVRLVLTERVIMGPQPSLFRRVGIEPFDAKIVVLKSGIGYKATYGHIAKAVLHADCPGPVSRNVTNFDFNRVPRPIFPLDTNFDWQPDFSGNTEQTSK
ncbi:M81 family metallopeptidase [Planctomycetota bacterium]